MTVICAVDLQHVYRCYKARTCVLRNGRVDRTHADDDARGSPPSRDSEFQGLCRVAKPQTRSQNFAGRVSPPRRLFESW